MALKQFWWGCVHIQSHSKIHTHTHTHTHTHVQIQAKIVPQPTVLDNTLSRHVSHTRITSDLDRMNVRAVLHLITSISHNGCPDLPSAWPMLLSNTWTKIEGSVFSLTGPTRLLRGYDPCCHRTVEQQYTWGRVDKTYRATGKREVWGGIQAAQLLQLVLSQSILQQKHALQKQTAYKITSTVMHFFGRVQQVVCS